MIDGGRAADAVHGSRATRSRSRCATPAGRDIFGRIEQRVVSGMILYDYWRSSSAWRVRIALPGRASPFERRAVNLRRTAASSTRAASARSTPSARCRCSSLDEGGPPRTLTQSMAILAYLEERFPSPPLLPARSLAARAGPPARRDGERRDPAAAEPAVLDQLHRRLGVDAAASSRASSSRAGWPRSRRRAGRRPGRSWSATRRPSPTSTWSRSSTPRAASASISRPSRRSCASRRPARRCPPSRPRTPTRSPTRHAPLTGSARPGRLGNSRPASPIAVAHPRSYGWPEGCCAEAT